MNLYTAFCRRVPTPDQGNQKTPFLPLTLWLFLSPFLSTSCSSCFLQSGITHREHLATFLLWQAVQEVQSGRLREEFPNSWMNLSVGRETNAPGPLPEKRLSWEAGRVSMALLGLVQSTRLLLLTQSSNPALPSTLWDAPTLLTHLELFLFSITYKQMDIDQCIATVQLGTTALKRRILHHLGSLGLERKKRELHC